MAKKNNNVHFRVLLQGHEKASVTVAILLVLIVGGVTLFSDQVNANIFGLYLELIGAILLGFGLVKTNDEMFSLTNHYETLHRQELVSRLTRDRFFVVLGVFLVALGIFVQIVGIQFFR